MCLADSVRIAVHIFGVFLNGYITSNLLRYYYIIINTISRALRALCMRLLAWRWFTMLPFQAVILMNIYINNICEGAEMDTHIFVAHKMWHMDDIGQFIYETNAKLFCVMRVCAVDPRQSSLYPAWRQRVRFVAYSKQYKNVHILKLMFECTQRTVQYAVYFSIAV